MMNIRNRIQLASLAVAAFLVAAAATDPVPPAGTFTTPEEAVKALAEVIETPDDARTEAMFGEGWREMLGSGDAVADREDALKTRAMILEKVAFEDLEGNRKVVLIGNDEWPFPIPLVQEGEDCPSSNRTNGVPSHSSVPTPDECIAILEYVGCSKPVIDHIRQVYSLGTEMIEAGLEFRRMVRMPSSRRALSACVPE